VRLEPGPSFEGGPLGRKGEVDDAIKGKKGRVLLSRRPLVRMYRNISLPPEDP